ncbi:hypothetical protein PI23P_11447 [Polaribacter irgensii 23-P]|uniref:Uncharacterized protein n=1 Tax=Polaribacter irgensii 23-P TaxID=313594 RepID=A4C1E2_9FLAO|nr:hypothetical protein PI23P_11447 [Polaribacter irgensii 23-P]
MAKILKKLAVFYHFKQPKKDSKDQRLTLFKEK